MLKRVGRTDDMVKKHKKYFIKDESLTSVDNDYFRHQDIADNMRRIIDNTEAPFNIAIIGKWGLGKSSLINLVLDPMKNDKDNYIVQEINAWKYEKDEIGKAFLKQLWQGISGKRLSSYSLLDKEHSRMIQEATKKDNESIDKKTIRYYGYTVISLLKTSVPVLFVTIILYAIYTFINLWYFKREEDSVLIYIFLTYCKNMGTLFFIPLLIWLGKLYMDNYNTEKHKKIEINYPLESKDDYEIYLEDKMKSILANKPNIKIITVIDDLDRLSANKITEALDTLKIFMNFKQCVFIVPFDDEIIKRVLDKKKYEGLAAEEEFVIQSELILDKLFQYKIYLPQLIKGDIKSYAVSICNKECGDFIDEYVDKKLLERILRNILIHSAVNTPRQVKKIVNIFVNNVMIARAREKAGKVELGFSTTEQGLKLLAKLSVLQADFNAFYDLLFEDSYVIDDIITGHRKSYIPNRLLENYFICTKTSCKIKKQYLPLLNFLINTEKYSNHLLLSYLYMAQDEISVMTGDKKQQELIAAVESSNFTTAMDLLEESPVLTKALINFIRYSEDHASLNNALIAGISVIDRDYVVKEYAEQLVDAVNERLPVIIKEGAGMAPERINWDNIILALQYAEQTENFVELIRTNLNCAMSKSDYNDFEYMITTLLRNTDILENDMKDKLADKIRQYIDYAETDIHTIIIWKDSVAQDEVKTYFGTEYFERICKEIIDNNNFTEPVITAFKESFALYNTTDNINESITMFEGAFAYPALHECLYDLLNQNSIAAAINSDIACDITKKLIAIASDKCTESTYELLTLLSYEIEKGDAPVYDTFFAANLKNLQLADMVISFSTYNSLSLLPKTIHSLIETGLNAEGYESGISSLLDLFSDEQAKAFWTAFKSYFNFSANKDYEIGLTICKQLYEKKVYVNSLLSIFKDVIIVTLPSRYDQANYFDMAAKAAIILYDDIDESLADKFAAAIAAALPLHTDESVRLLRMICKKNSEAAFVGYIEKVLTKVNEDNFKDVYSMIKTNKNRFSKENNNLTVLINFYLDNVKNTKQPMQLLQDLDSSFKSIPSESLKKMIADILEYDLNITETEPFVTKILNCLDEATALKIILDTLKTEQVASDQAYDLFKNAAVIKGEYLNDPELISAYSAENLLALCKLLSVDAKAMNQQAYFNMLERIILKEQRAVINDDAMYCLQKLPDHIIKENKKEITKLSQTIFSNTTSDKLKKTVVDYVKLHKMIRSFKALLNDAEVKKFAELMK